MRILWSDPRGNGIFHNLPHAVRLHPFGAHVRTPAIPRDYCSRALHPEMPRRTRVRSWDSTSHSETVLRAPPKRRSVVGRCAVCIVVLVGGLARFGQHLWVGEMLSVTGW